MNWVMQLDNKRGSRPRCVLLVDGNPNDVAERLTQIVNLPDVVVSPDDKWMPCGKPVLRENGLWDMDPAKEVRLSDPNCLVSCAVQQQLKNWWLVHGGNTPNWDIASTCTIKSEPGLLLVEAKAHRNELSEPDKCGSGNSENLKRICCAIAEASAGLESMTGNPWALSLDHHFQLSNRFAWSWKLVSLGIPVVLLYLGFLNAREMGGQLFQSKAEWQKILKKYCEGVVDNTRWGEWLYCKDVPLIPLIRAFDQPFDPDD